MRPPTPPQVRDVVVRLYEQKQTYEEIAELTGLGVATVNRIIRSYRETGSTAPAEPGGGNFSPIRGKIEERLKKLVAAMPDATVKELSDALQEAEHVETSRSSVQRALARLGYSRKKRASSR